MGAGHPGGMVLGMDGSGGGVVGNHVMMDKNFEGRTVTHPMQLPLHMGVGLSSAVGIGPVDGMVEAMDSSGRAEQRRRRWVLYCLIWFVLVWL